MYIPFLGHILSGIYMLIFLFFENLPSEYLWIQSMYCFFGGWTVLQIAMYGYIGDVTNSK